MNWVLGSGLMTNPVRLVWPNAVVKGPAISLGTSWNGMPPISNSDRFPRRHLVEPEPHLLGDAGTHLFRGDIAVQHERSSCGIGHDLGEQVVELQHLDIAIFHLGDEVEVVPAGLLHPQHVVVEQVLGGIGGQASCASPGGQTITRRSLPISDQTPTSGSLSVTTVPFGRWVDGDRRRDNVRLPCPALGEPLRQLGRMFLSTWVFRAGRPTKPEQSRCRR